MSSHNSLPTSSLQVLGQYPLHGGCPCSHVRYTITTSPLIVNACHCTNCQRQTGTAFALNAFYEPSLINPVLSTGEIGLEASSKLLLSALPSPKGGPKGQVMHRCPRCYCVLWSSYHGLRLCVVRVGTIDGVVDGEGRYVPCGGLRPDAHLFVGGKSHDWIGLEGERVFAGLAMKEDYWSEESLERFRVFVAEETELAKDRRSNE